MWRWKRSWIEEVREEDKVEQSEKDQELMEQDEELGEEEKEEVKGVEEGKE